MEEPLINSEFVRELDRLMKEHFPAGTTLYLGNVNVLMSDEEYLMDSSSFRLRIPRASSAESPHGTGRP